MKSMKVILLISVIFSMSIVSVSADNPALPSTNISWIGKDVFLTPVLNLNLGMAYNFSAHESYLGFSPGVGYGVQVQPDWFSKATIFSLNLLATFGTVKYGGIDYLAVDPSIVTSFLVIFNVGYTPRILFPISSTGDLQVQHLGLFGIGYQVTSSTK